MPTLHPYPSHLRSPHPRRAIDIQRAKIRMAHAVIDDAKLTGRFDWLVDVPWDEALTAKTTHEFMSNLMISDPDTALVSS